MCQKGPLGGALFWLVVSMITYTVGFGTPSWIVHRNSTGEQIGLWQVCTNLTCHDVQDVLDESWLRVTQILACVTLALLVADLIITSIITCRRQTPSACLSFIAVLSLASAGLAFATVTQFYVSYDGQGEVGYSYALCMLTGFMLIISVFLAGLQCCCPSRYNNSELTPLLSREVV